MKWKACPQVRGIGKRSKNRREVRSPSLRPGIIARYSNLAGGGASSNNVRKGYRKQGVMSALIVAALKAAKRAKAPALEAYPVDTDAPKRTSNLFTGAASTFARAGFKTVARHVPHRPMMRHDLKAIAR